MSFMTAISCCTSLQTCTGNESWQAPSAQPRTSPLPPIKKRLGKENGYYVILFVHLLAICLLLIFWYIISWFFTEYLVARTNFLGSYFLWSCLLMLWFWHVHTLVRCQDRKDLTYVLELKQRMGVTLLLVHFMLALPHIPHRMLHNGSTVQNRVT